MHQNRQILNRETLQTLYEQLQTENPNLDLDRIRQVQDANYTFLQNQYQQIIDNNNQDQSNNQSQQNSQIDYFPLNEQVSTYSDNDYFNQTLLQNSNLITLNQQSFISIFDPLNDSNKIIDKYAIVKQLYNKKKYNDCLNILFKMNKEEKNQFIIEKIAMCFYQLQNYQSSIIFAQKLQKFYKRNDKYQKILGSIYGKRAIKQNKIYLAKKSIFYFGQVFKNNKNIFNQQNLEKIKFVKYYLVIQKKKQAKKLLLNYLKKFQIKSFSSCYLKQLNINIKIPYYLKCVISMDIINKPIISPSGVTYEKSLLNKVFFNKKKAKDPVTRQNIYKKNCIKNKVLQKIIIRFKNQNPSFIIKEYDTKNFKLSNIDFVL